MIKHTYCPILGSTFYFEDPKPRNRKERRGKKTRKSNNSRPRWKE